jgi:type IV secretory pathway VirJ component
LLKNLIKIQLLIYTFKNYNIRKIKMYLFLSNKKSLKAICLMVISFFCLFLLNSCGLLLKNVFYKNNGIKRTDFNLPVITYASTIQTKKSLIVLFSGDGGWIDFDDKLAIAFASNGYNTVGFNSRSYFWNKKTPRKTANDLAMLMNIYIKEYQSKNVILCGYSFGADVVPFIYNRLPLNLKNKVKSLVLLSPFASTDFEVHTSDLLNIGGDKREFKVFKEVEKIKVPTYCFYGEQESNRPLIELKRNNFFVDLLPGDHHYKPSSYQIILNSVIKKEE